MKHIKIAKTILAFKHELYWKILINDVIAKDIEILWCHYYSPRASFKSFHYARFPSVTNQLNKIPRL